MRKTLYLALLAILLVSTGCRGATPPPAPTPVPTVAPAATAEVAESGAGNAPVDAPPETDDALLAHPWEWVSFMGAVESFSVDPPSSYILAFNDDGTLAVTADCNAAGGTYAAEDGSLTIEIGSMTRAACAEGSRSNQFVELLDSVVRYGFEDDRLRIDLMADGGSLTFDPAGAETAGRGVMPSFGGPYKLRPLDDQGDVDYYLVLNEDGTGEIDERPIGSTDPNDTTVGAKGTWTADGSTILLELTEADGEVIDEGDFILRITFENGFPAITDIKVDRFFAHLDGSTFSIGAGERGPLVRELHRQLATVDYLEFTDPGNDVYGELTRQAVVAFQQAQGLHPNGVVDDVTWRRLYDDLEPLPTPTPLAPASEEPAATQLTATTTDGVNVRSGPGTQYGRLGTANMGTALQVTGRNEAGTWVQVAYPDATSRAWVSADYVTLSGDLVAVPVATEVTAAESTPAPGTAAADPPRMGIPNLDDLPAYTEDGSPIVYFTFDDGPQSNSTDVIADLFEQYGGTTTFFVVGQSVVAHPDLVRDAAAKGHYIADHTWDHGDLAGMTREQFVNEVERTRQAVLEAAGDLFNLDRDVRYVRPPYGSTDANTRQYAANLGMTVVLWTIDPQDWRRPGADVIANHILSHVKPGSIVLSHDGGGERSQTIAAYQTVLPELASQGYVFRNIFTP